MYCPKCGQQQISDEMRFCSRCGLPIGGLSDWIGGTGVPAKNLNEPASQLTSPRREAIRRSAKLMFVSGVLLPVCLVFSLIFDEGAIMLLPIPVFFVALVMMLYARLFTDNTPRESRERQPLGEASTRGREYLPPGTSIPIRDLSGQARTNELAQPQSVTEHTTRLLDDER